MERPDNLAVDDHLADRDEAASIGREVREALAARPRRLPSKYFYDERGSRLFERITELPEYYLTRAEQALLDADAGNVAALTRFEELAELGSGAARKTRTLLDAGLTQGSLRRFLPVEVSAETAEAAAREVAAGYPGLEVHAVVADFETDLDKVPPAPPRRLLAFLGSTIGNFPRRQAVALLRRLGALLGEEGRLLLGTDLVKDRETLEAAYNDAQGVTARFNANILRVINHRLDGDFDLERFEHVAFYDEAEQRIESYLRSTAGQTVRLRRIGLEVALERGEMIRTEVSCKYTRESVVSMLRAAGLTLERWTTDQAGTFALSLSR